MKAHLIAFAFLLPALCFGQTEPTPDLSDCQKLVVWNLTHKEEDSPTLARAITGEIEEILVGITGCYVLERRNLGTLLGIIENEDNIESLSKASAKAKNALKTVRAETVLFGSVKQDVEISGGTIITLRIESLTTLRILAAQSRILSAEDIAPLKRKIKLTSLIREMLGLPSTERDVLWEKALRSNTLDAYDLYLQKCKASPTGCLHQSDAQTRLVDERLWRKIGLINKDKKTMGALCDYIENGRTQHLSEAEQVLGNLMDKHKKRNSRRWIWGGVFELVGIAGLVTGGMIESRARPDYDTYKNERNENALIYQSLGREALYSKANKKHKIAQGFTGAGIALLVGGLVLHGERLFWIKPLQRGEKFAPAPLSNSTYYGELRLSEEYPGLCFQVHF